MLKYITLRLICICIFVFIHMKCTRVVAWIRKKSDAVTSSVIRRVQVLGEAQNEQLISSCYIYLCICICLPTFLHYQCLHNFKRLDRWPVNSDWDGRIRWCFRHNLRVYPSIFLEELMVTLKCVRILDVPFKNRIGHSQVLRLEPSCWIQYSIKQSGYFYILLNCISARFLLTTNLMHFL